MRLPPSTRPSLEAPFDEILGAVRSHWEVENKLHWVLDVVFREDDCRYRTGYSPENFSAIKQFALNLIKQEPSKNQLKESRTSPVGMRNSCFECCWGESFKCVRPVIFTPTDFAEEARFLAL